ncbi:DUF397 domain-containing protein [Actinocorallia lasiicapitis]
MSWRKSSYSGGIQDDACVELAQLSSAVGVRDSKNPGVGHLALTVRQFGALAGGLKGR